MNTNDSDSNRTFDSDDDDVDVAVQAQIQNGYPLQPVSKILPRRLFLIYGLESSGTTFVAKTIGTALGIPSTKTRSDFTETRDNSDHVQHISLPWGGIKPDEYGFYTQFSVPLPTIPVFYPKPCQMNPITGSTNGFPNPPQLRPPPTKECREIMDDQVMTRPHRFFVNMTTHITWYRERGVLVYPIMVIRDPGLHFHGIADWKTGHNRHEASAYLQYEMGRAIMTETMEKGLNPIIISYETMLTLQRPYLCQLYDTLGIDSDFLPTFKNGNTKYLQQDGLYEDWKEGFDLVELELMKEDNSQPEDSAPQKHRRHHRMQRKNKGNTTTTTTTTTTSRQWNDPSSPGGGGRGGPRISDVTRRWNDMKDKMIASKEHRQRRQKVHYHLPITRIQQQEWMKNEMAHNPYLLQQAKDATRASSSTLERRQQQQQQGTMPTNSTNPSTPTLMIGTENKKNETNPVVIQEDATPAASLVEQQEGTMPTNSTNASTPTTLMMGTENKKNETDPVVIREDATLASSLEQQEGTTPTNSTNASTTTMLMMGTENKNHETDPVAIQEDGTRVSALEQEQPWITPNSTNTSMLPTVVQE